MQSPLFSPHKRLVVIHPTFATSRVSLPALFSNSHTAYLRLHLALTTWQAGLAELQVTYDLPQIKHLVLDEVDALNENQLETFLVDLLDDVGFAPIILITREWPSIFDAGSKLRDLVQLWPVDERNMLVDYAHPANTMVLSAFGFGMGSALFNGRAVTLKPDVRRLLFAILTQGKQAVSRDALLEMLWPDESPRKAQSNLSAVRQQLNETFDLELLAPSTSLTQFNPDVQIHHDANEYETLLTEAHESLEPPDPQVLRLANHIHRRPFLANSHGHWVSKRRRDLLDLRTNYLVDIARNCIANAQYQQALVYYLRAFAFHPIRQDVVSQIFQLCERLNQPCAVHRIYQRFKSALQQEGIPFAPYLHEDARKLMQQCDQLG